MRDDFFERTVVWAMVSFLLFEALMPSQYSNFSFLFLMLQSTLIYVLAIAKEGQTTTGTTARVLITYIALAALLIE